MELSEEEVNSLINKLPSGEIESYSKQYLIHIRSFVIIRRNLKRIARCISTQAKEEGEALMEISLIEPKAAIN